MSRRFSGNIKKSAERYLRLTYSTEEIVNGISDREELKRYLEAIEDAISQSEGISFRGCYEGSSPFLWRW